MFLQKPFTTMLILFAFCDYRSFSSSSKASFTLSPESFVTVVKYLFALRLTSIEEYNWRVVRLGVSPSKH